MKKTIAASLIITMSLLGCAGRASNPVMQDQVGDNKKSCKALETEMAGIQAQIQTLIPESDKTGKNVGLGIAGVFLIVPFFFMDLTDSEKTEITAYRMRYNRLQTIASQKNCPFLEVTPDTGSAAPESVEIMQPNGVKVTEAEKVSPARTSIMPPSAVNDSPNPAKKLEDLNTMLKKGLITQDEYNAKKTQILNSM